LDEKTKKIKELEDKNQILTSKSADDSTEIKVSEKLFYEEQITELKDNLATTNKQAE
jgi:hypothetical protein